MEESNRVSRSIGTSPPAAGASSASGESSEHPQRERGHGKARSGSGGKWGAGSPLSGHAPPQLDMVVIHSLLITAFLVGILRLACAFWPLLLLGLLGTGVPSQVPRPLRLVAFALLTPLSAVSLWLHRWLLIVILASGAWSMLGAPASSRARLARALAHLRDPSQELLAAAGAVLGNIINSGMYMCHSWMGKGASRGGSGSRNSGLAGALANLFGGQTGAKGWGSAGAGGANRWGGRKDHPISHSEEEEAEGEGEAQWGHTEKHWHGGSEQQQEEVSRGQGLDEQEQQHREEEHHVEERSSIASEAQGSGKSQHGSLHTHGPEEGEAAKSAGQHWAGGSGAAVEAGHA